MHKKYNYIYICGDFKLEKIRIQELPSDTVAQLVRASAQLAEVLDSNTSSVKFVICSVVYFLLCTPLMNGWKVQFQQDLHNLRI